MIYGINSISNTNKYMPIFKGYSNSIVSYNNPFTDEFTCMYINKPFNMSKAKTEADIPIDANIFIFNEKTKVKLPSGIKAKECILSDENISSITKMFRSPAMNTMHLDNIVADYVHGENTGNGRVFGVADIYNSSINQLENIKSAKIIDSDINYISNMEDVEVSNSRLHKVEIEGDLSLKNNSIVDSVKAYALETQPGDMINNVNTNFITCKKDNNTNNYSYITDVTANMGANIAQAKIDNLSTSELILKDSNVKNVNADYGIQISNSEIDNLSLGRIKKISNCGINNFEIKSSNTKLELHDKIQINKLSLNGSDNKLFITSNSDADNKNFLGNVVVNNVDNDETPILKIQGDINIGQVDFNGKRGILKLTRSANETKHFQPIVNNGDIIYCDKLEDVNTEETED